MNYKIIYILIVLGLVLSSGCLDKTVTQEDFDLSAEWDREYNTDERGSHFADGVFYDRFLVETTSKTDTFLFYRLYIHDLEDESTIGRTPCVVGRSLPYYAIKLTPQTIEQSKEIKICVSSDQNFNKNDEGVVCKSVSLPQRKIDFEVTPSPVSFRISKSVFGEQYEWITVKNTGDIGLTIQIFPPNSGDVQVKSLNYPVYKPQYGTRDNNWEKLNPGESKRFKVYAYVGNFVGDFEERNTPVGTYYSEGYVCALFDTASPLVENANYKKTFTLETTVVE